MTCEIDEIRGCPEFADRVIDRIWRAWWQPRGHPRSVIETPVQRNLASCEPLPFCLVAHVGGRFLGTVSVIASDVESRPLLTPWLAALWVEPAQRRAGVAGALLQTATSRTFDLGERQLYLYCADAMRAFYERRGWRLHEPDVPAPHMCILRHTGRRGRKTGCG